MRSTFLGLEIGKRGLFVAQGQQDITGHNIANVDTVGFTRQRMSTASIAPKSGYSVFNVDKGTAYGHGVEAVSIEQIRNPFLDYQYRKENATTSQWQAKEQFFGYVESLFNNELDSLDVASGISSTFNNFYRSLYKLVEDPADKTIRTNLKESADKLTENMNYYYSRLLEQQTNLNLTIKESTMQINDLAEQIADLNRQIFGFELSGAKANDLRDQRNLMLDELSTLVNIETFEDNKGYLNVQIDGKYLIRATTFNQLEVKETKSNPISGSNGEPKLYEIYWKDQFGGEATDKLNIRDGAIKGYMDIRDGSITGQIGIPYVMNLLNDLCAKIVEEVNAIHTKGYTMPYKDANGVSTTSKNGINFFEPAKPGERITAQNMRLSSDILANIYNIAASDMPIVEGDDNEQRGNSKNALKLSELIGKVDSSGNPDNFDSHFKNIITGTGLEMSKISKTYKAQDVMRAHVVTQKNSISAVSLDEEMTNMVRFGHAYTAASRVITTMDEQLDTIINRMGMVGR